MKNSSAEFTRINFVNVFSCLSPESKFAEDVSLDKASGSFSYETDDRENLISILFDEDEIIGGKV